MREFSAVEAATTGFRLMKERPKTIAAWAGFYLVYMIAVALLVFALLGVGFFNSFDDLAPGETPDLDSLMSGAGTIILPLLLMIPIAFIYSAMQYGAVNRAVLRPEEGGFGFFRLGGDELRLILFTLVYGLLAVGAVLALVLVVAILRSVSGVLAGIGGIAAACGVIYLGVRLSLAMPMTFARRKLNIFGSWELTRGRFWPMLGAYLLSGLFAVAVTIAAVIVILIVGGMFVGSASISMAGASGGVGSAGAIAVMLFVQLLNLAIQAALSAVILAITVSVPAAIYRELTGSEAAEVF